MLLPYASDRPVTLTRRTLMTGLLIAAQIACMLAVVIVARPGGAWEPYALFATFGIVPARFNPLTLLSYSFLHDGWAHLLTNLFYLWVFGGGVEEAVGRRRFLLLFLTGGAVGGALQALVTTALLPPVEAARPIVGASAGCACLIGLFAVRYYRSRLAFIGLPWRPHVVTVVVLFLALEIGSGLWSVFSATGASGVAHWAHIGGFVFGLTMAQVLRLDVAGQRAYLTTDAAQAMRTMQPGEAIKKWETLLKREPNSETARVELARAWLLLGDSGQAGQHYLAAIRQMIGRNHRTEAAQLYAEMIQQGVKPANLQTGLLFPLGSALEEEEEYAMAAETLRSITVRHPESAEAETALLKVISLYVHHLNRREEAKILARLFLERYPRSQWRAFAEDLLRAAGQ